MDVCVRGKTLTVANIKHPVHILADADNLEFVVGTLRDELEKRLADNPPSKRKVAAGDDEDVEEEDDHSEEDQVTRMAKEAVTNHKGLCYAASRNGFLASCKGSSTKKVFVVRRSATNLEDEIRCQVARALHFQSTGEDLPQPAVF